MGPGILNKHPVISKAPTHLSLRKGDILFSRYHACLHRLTRSSLCVHVAAACLEMIGAAACLLRNATCWSSSALSLVTVPREKLAIATRLCFFFPNCFPTFIQKQFIIGLVFTTTPRLHRGEYFVMCSHVYALVQAFSRNLNF